MKKKLSFISIIALVLCVSIFAACNKIIPDPTPGDSVDVEPAPRFEMDWTDGNQVDTIFEKDDQWSAVLSVTADNKGKIKVDGTGYNQSGYGSYTMKLSIDTVEYPFLVFDVAELSSTFQAKPEYTEDLMFKTSRPGITCIDFTKMPKKYTSRKLDVNLVLYIDGADKEVIINSISQSKTNPIVSSDEIQFAAGDEAKFQKLNGLQLAIADGKGTFTLANDALASGTAEFNLKINTSAKRYFTVGFAEKAYLGISVALNEGGEIDLVPEGWREGGSEYVFDLNTLPAAYTGKEVLVHVKLTVYKAADSNAVIDFIATANDKTASPVNSTVIDFGYASGNQLYNFNYMEFNKSGSEGLFNVTNGGDPEWGSGWCFINVTIDTSLYRYIVFEVGRDTKLLARFTTYKPSGEAIANYDFVPDGSYSNERIGYDLNNLPDEFKGSQKIIQVRLASYAGSKINLKTITLSDTMPAAEAPERIDFNNGDDAIFSGYDFLSLNVANGKGTFTVLENGDIWGTGTVKFKIKIDASQRRYFVTKLSGNTDMILRFSVNETNYDLVGEASRRAGEVYYDLQRLPQNLWDSIIQPKVAVYKSAGNAVIDEMYTTNTLPDELNVADFSSFTKDKFGVFGEEYATTSLENAKLQISISDGGNPEYNSGWAKIHLPINTDIFRYIIFDVAANSDLLVRLNEGGDIDLVPEKLYSTDTLVCYDLHNLPLSLKGKANVLKDVKFITKSGATINSIKLSNTAPVPPPVDTTPKKIEFNDGDEALFGEFNNMSLSVANGKGTFTTSGVDGNVSFILKLEASVNRYIVFNLANDTNIIVRYTFNNVDYDFISEGERREGAYYFDLKTLPSEAWNEKITVKLALYNSAGTCILDLIDAVNVLPAEQNLVDFSKVTFNPATHYGFWGAEGTDARIVDGTKLELTKNGTVNEWNCGSININLPINTSLYRYMAINILADTEVVVRFNKTGSDYDFVLNKKYMTDQTLYYDLECLPAAFKGKPAMLFDIIISTPSAASITSIKLVNGVLPQQKIGLTEADFSDAGNLNVAIDENGKMNFDVINDADVVGGIFVTINVDFTLNRFIYIDVADGALGVRYTFDDGNGNLIDFDFVQETKTNTPAATYVYDLGKLPDATKSSGTLKFKIYAYWDELAIINSISLA